MTVDAPPPASTMRRDLASAYVASGMKVLSWAFMSSFILRYAYFEALGVFALIRGTLGLLNYTAVGLAPATIRMIAQVTAVRRVTVNPLLEPPAENQLNYRSPPVKETDPLGGVLANAYTLALLVGLVGYALVKVYAWLFPVLHKQPDFPPIWAIREFVVAFGVGMLLRLFSDIGGAVIQTGGLIWLDNLLQLGAEVLWVALVFIQRYAIQPYPDSVLVLVGASYCWSAVALVAARLLFASAIGAPPWKFRMDRLRVAVMWELLKFGGLLTVAQLADFLYAPTDFILINRLLSSADAAAYLPAVQIDAGLLLLVTGLASVLLPKAALAHAGGDLARVRTYYARGTIASLTMLVAASAATCLLSPWIFKLWLGNSMPATQAILPLVLIHTVVGGSSAVGRSILLGMGKVKPFTIAVLIAGVSNVILSYSFVRFGGLGLNGIVLGTICAVVGRCAIWQPWYVWRSLNSPETRPS